MVSDNYSSRFAPTSSACLWSSLQSAVRTEAQMDGTFRAPDVWGTDSSAAFTDVTNGFSPVISQNTL